MRLESRGVVLRPLSLRDRRQWRATRQRNVAWLQRWDATAPPGVRPRGRSFASMVRSMRAAARAGLQLPFVIEVDGRLVGQLTVNNIVRGSGQFASIGYWIDERFAGRGITTRAVAMVVDHCFTELGLHRIELAIRPENAASLRVPEKLGFTEYGLAPRFLHIDGDWRDHRLFQLLKEDAWRGVVRRLDAATDEPNGLGSHQSQE